MRHFKTIVVQEEPDAAVAVATRPLCVICGVAEGDTDAHQMLGDNPHTFTLTRPTPVSAKVPSINKSFLFAGRATFVAENNKGDHFTFRVGSQESEWPVGSGKRQRTFFLNVKAPGGKRWSNGSQSPWRYLGVLKESGDIKTTQKSEFADTDKLFIVAKWAIKCVIDGSLLPEGYEIRHAGKCGKCGRELTDPESLDRGIGPECASVMGIA